METAAVAKRNQYHQLQLFLEDRYPEHNLKVTVSNLRVRLSYIMSRPRTGAQKPTLGWVDSDYASDPDTRKS
eukprot:2172979-Rhodomonas_salina.2